MARRSLKPQLNQIRAWVRQGRTDAWIAHQLEISASELREFRKQHNLTADGEDGGAGEVDLRDEIEAEVEAATAEEVDEAEGEETAAPEAEAEEETEAEEEAEAEEAPAPEAEKEETPREKEPARRRRERPKPKEKEPSEPKPAKAEEAGDGGKGGGRSGRKRRRGRRGGRGRRKEIEATFDHGETDGYGLWLDPSVKDNPVYAEHWAGKRAVTVRIEADQIVIRRAGEDSGGNSGS